MNRGEVSWRPALSGVGACSSIKTTHRWAVAQQNPEPEKELSAGLGMPGLVARGAMVAHGITSIEEGDLAGVVFDAFARSRLPDPLVIPGMEPLPTASSVPFATTSTLKMRIFGDFDVDGINPFTSTRLLTEALRT